MLKEYAAVLDTGVGGGTPCYFDSFTNVSSGASFYQEDATIKGTALATVQLQITAYANDNSVGQLYVNGTVCTLNQIVNITLDAMGEFTYTQRVQGNPTEAGTYIYGIVSIVGVSAGYISSPSSRTVSKIF